MPLIRRLAAVLLVPSLLAASASAAETQPRDRPLAGSRLTMADSQTPAKRRVAFAARWKGAVGEVPNPGFEGSSLRISGDATSDGDSGLIKLVPGAWKALPKGKGFRYDDGTGSAGGVRSIQLKLGKKGGSLKVQGGDQNWAYRLTGPQSGITVTLRIGDVKFCSRFDKPKTKGSKLVAKAPRALDSCPCQTFTSTFAAIQQQIFERRGCTSAACHGAAAAGSLDLRADVAYRNLVGVVSPTHGIERVRPGGKQDSFLWQKLAAGRGDWQLTGGSNAPMPLGLPPLSAEELDVVGRWIHDGAEESKAVDGTEELLGSCLPPVTPPAIIPPAKPAPGTGVQFFAPAWSIQPAGVPAPVGRDYGDNGEDEVCYATYFDLVRDGIVPPDKVVDCPDFWKSPTNPSGKCYVYDRTELTQEPNSHHSIIHIYRGQYPAAFREGHCFGVFDTQKPCDLATGSGCAEGETCREVGFGFRCHDGETPGAACDPADPAACPAGQECRGAVHSALACLNYGPPDFTDVGSAVNGNGAANSPSVGGSQQPYRRNALPEGVFGVFPVQGVIVWNSHAFNVWDQAVQNRQWWNIYFTDPNDPQEVRYNLRGIFDSTDIFVQQVPPFEEREYCRTVTFGKGTRLFELSSHTHKRGRLFRVFAPPIAQSCRSTEADSTACVPESTPPILTTTEYNDPAQVSVTPDRPYHALDSDDPAQRRFKFCAIYDNGATDPALVKRNSQSPIPPTFGPFAPGGPCYAPPLRNDSTIACVNDGKRGQPCDGDDRACDSAPGVRDGVCDACPLLGGVTTEDEMFILLGAFYCDPSVPGQTCTGVCSGGPRQGQACNDDSSQCPGPAGSCTGGKCRSGILRDQACTSDADCWRACIPYTN